MSMKRIIYAVLLLIGWAVEGLAQDTLRSTYNDFFLQAICERQKGNSDAAFDLLRHCIEINPEASEAYFFLAQYYARLKDKDKTLAYLERACQLEPDNSTYMETLAQTYVSQGFDGKAIDVLEQLYSRENDRDDVLAMLYELYQRQADPENAIRTLERLEQLDGKNERITMAKADLYTQMGKKEEAIGEMKALADQYPNDLNFRVMYGDALLQNDQKKKALQVFQSVLAQEPENIQAMLSMVNYHTLEGDTLKARQMTESILLSKSVDSEVKLQMMRREIMNSLRGDNDTVRIMNLFQKVLAQPQTDADMALLCASYMQLNNLSADSITAMYGRALEIAPDNAHARLQLVVAAWEQDDMERVISLCQAARQYNPEEMAFYYYQGMAYYRQDDVDHALGAFQNGVSVITDESNPNIASEFYAVLGDLLHQKGREAEAYDAYEACLRYKSDNVNCLNNYAYYLSMRGEELEKAEQMSHRAIKAEPENPTYLDTYAWVLFKIEQTLQYDTDASAVVLEHAGDIFYKAGDQARAVEYWQQALQKSGNNSEIKGDRLKILKKKIKQKKYIKE